MKSVKGVSKTMVGIGALVLVAGIAGCALFMGETLKSAQIQASSAKAIRVDGKPVLLEKLVSTLKSMGAGRNTLITVEVAQDAPSATAKLVSDTLIHGGFPKVVIAKRRPPTVSVAPVKPR